MFEGNEDRFSKIYDKVYALIDQLLKVSKKAESESDNALADDSRTEQMLNLLGELGDAEGELRRQTQKLAEVRSDLEIQRRNFQNLFEYAPDGYLVTDRKATIIQANQAAAKLLNVEQKDLFGKSFVEFIDPNEISNFRKQLRKLPRVKRRKYWEITIKPADQKSFYAELSVAATPIESSQDGKKADSEVSLQLHWSIRDISLQRQAEDTIKETSQQLELIKEIALAANEANDLEDALQFTVDQICEYTGWPIGHVYLREDIPYTKLIPTSIWHLEKPEVHQEFRSVTEKRELRYGEGLSGQVLARRKPLWIMDVSRARGFLRKLPEKEKGIKAGMFFPILVGKEVAGVLEFFSSHAIEPNLGLLEVMEQIGLILGRVLERKRAEEILNESEARFRVIFEQTDVGIDLVDLKGNIIHTNPALREMLGYSAEEFRRMNIKDYTHPDDVEFSRSLMGKLIQGELDRYQIDKRYIRKDGSTVWAHLRVSLLRDESGDPQYALGVIENVSRQKELEMELIELERRLIDSKEAERLFLAQELHDGPLQDLIASTYQLNMIKSALQDEQSLTFFQESQNSLQKVIRNLRVICGELRPPSLTPFGIEKAIRSHASQFQESHPEINIGLDLMNDDRQLPERIRLAIFRIYQHAMLNIIRHAEANSVLVRFHFDESEVRLEIQDDGRGFIVPDKLIDLVRKGHFGLVGAVERAEAIGGKLIILSKPGEGTILKVVAPRDGNLNRIPEERFSLHKTFS